MENQEDEIAQKRQYLRTEILDQGYDPQEFNDYMCKIKNEDNIELSNWTLQEIIDVVKSYKEYSTNKENEEKQNKEKEDNENQIKENIKKDSNNNQEPEPEPDPEIKKKSNTIVSIPSSSQSLISNDPFFNYLKTVNCDKLEPNQITNRDDLYVTISEPQRVKQGFFSMAYYQYTVKTYPMNYNVIRKVSDFSFLSKKLPLINPAIYTPELPSFPFSLKDDSPKKMRFIQNYMNLLIENKYFRTLPIVYDFITLPQDDWNNKVKAKYRKIEKAKKFSSMPNLEGKYNLKITNADELKASAIKKDIEEKNELYKQLYESIEVLLTNIEKISSNFSYIAFYINELKKNIKAII